MGFLPGKRKKRKKKGKKTRKAQGRILTVSSLLFLAMVAALLVSLFRAEWDRQQEPDAIRPASPAWAVGILARGIREIGVNEKHIRSGLASDGETIFRFPCPDHLHPITANRWLSRILQEEGLEILECREEGRTGRPTLHYRLFVPGSDHLFLRLRMDPPSGDPALQEQEPVLAIVIDDFGYNYGPTVRGFLDLDIPLTTSILPGLRRSERVEREARKRGRDIFLHLPMEPLGWPEDNPGPGAVFTGISRDSLHSLLDSHYESFRFVSGLNNHMGSRACQDSGLMADFLDWVKEKDLLVLDSWTHPQSKLFDMARERGARSLKCDLFLDGKGETESGIAENLMILTSLARERGRAVGIGHPRKETLAVLERMIPRLQDYDFRFVTISELAKKKELEP